MVLSFTLLFLQLTFRQIDNDKICIEISLISHNYLRSYVPLIPIKFQKVLFSGRAIFYLLKKENRTQIDSAF